MRVKTSLRNSSVNFVYVCVRAPIYHIIQCWYERSPNANRPLSISRSSVQYFTLYIIASEHMNFFAPKLSATKECVTQCSAAGFPFYHSNTTNSERMWVGGVGVGVTSHCNAVDFAVAVVAAATCVFPCEKSTAGIVFVVTNQICDVYCLPFSSLALCEMISMFGVYCVYTQWWKSIGYKT